VQHDNLTKKVNTFQKEGTLEGVDQYFGVNAEKAFVEAQAKVKKTFVSEIDKSLAMEKEAEKIAGKMSDAEMELRGEFPGITDDLVNNILTDDNPQRIAEIKATMNEALKMREKGMGPDEIIQMFRKTPRTKQADGGLINILKL
jgi:transcriptional regulator with PAS, ATPase and Fis domain